MQTYRCVIEYDGTDFSGWQFQPEQRTVCGAVERTLSSLFDEPIKVTCAGRTDTGVHATGQTISFTSERRFPIQRLALALNANLPPDVTARDATLAPEGFSARHHALSRTYEYVILNRAMPSATLRRFAHHVYKPIDHERFRHAADHMVGIHDFVSFCGVHPDRGGTVRTITSIDIECDADIVRVRIEGLSFLHRMIRITIGTLVEIATGRRDADDIPRIIAACDREAAGYTAPATGLYLAGVRYADFDSYRRVRVPIAETL